MTSDALRCYVSSLGPCGYLDDRWQRNLVVDPATRPDAASYEYLTAQGFRRNGNHLYRPYCPKCSACTPIRIDANAFVPNRSQKRNLRRNSDLEISLENTSDNEEFYGLFSDYVRSRHAQSSMTGMSKDDYRAFLFCDWLPTRMLTARLDGVLYSASLLDLLPNSFSAVYTFYRPDQIQRGLGTFAVLKMVEAALELDIEYVNLGYWIEEAPTMNYKRGFSATELATDGEWETWLQDN